MEKIDENKKEIKQPNIIFIVIDTLRADHLSCYGYNKNTSPNIDRIAKQGVLFKNCYINKLGSEAGFTTIATGMDPQVHGICGPALRITDEQKKNLKDVNLKTLAEFLKENKYITIGLAWMGKWHKKGFDFYLDPSDKDEKMKTEKFFSNILSYSPKLKRIASKLYGGAFSFLRHKITGFKDSKLVADSAINLIEKHKNNKFFMFVHFEDAHTPYMCPKEYIIKSESNNILVKDLLDGMNNKQLAELYRAWWGKLKHTSEIIDLYDGCISMIDYQVNRIIEKAKELNLYDDTLFIITADHGESLIEHGAYFAHHKLFEGTAHIPLIFLYPKIINKNVINDSLIQQSSITPTILDLLGIENTNYEFDGFSLKDCLINNKTMDNKFILMGEIGYCQDEYAIKTKKYKFIQLDHKNECDFCQGFHGEQDQLFDLENDPYELNNIYNEKKEFAQELKNLIKIKIKKLNHKREKIILRNKIKNLKI